MVRSIAYAFHDGRSVARVVTVFQSFRQRSGISHEGVVGVVSVDRDLINDDNGTSSSGSW